MIANNYTQLGLYSMMTYTQLPNSWFVSISTK